MEKQIPVTLSQPDWQLLLVTLSERSKSWKEEEQGIINHFIGEVEVAVAKKEDRREA